MIPLDMGPADPVFHSFFEIKDLNHFPQAYNAGDPVFKGIFEDNDRRKRLMAIINYNTDVSQFWEWSGRGFRPFALTSSAAIGAGSSRVGGLRASASASLNPTAKSASRVNRGSVRAAPKTGDSRTMGGVIMRRRLGTTDRSDARTPVIRWLCFLSPYGMVPQPPRRRGGSPVTPIQQLPEAVVITNRGGFIRSMNGAATTLLGLPPRIHAHPGQIGLLFVKGRVAVRTALREVLVGGPAVMRPASILPTGGGLRPLTVCITALDDGFRWVLRPAPITPTTRSRHAAARRR